MHKTFLVGPEGQPYYEPAATIMGYGDRDMEICLNIKKALHRCGLPCLGGYREDDWDCVNGQGIKVSGLPEVGFEPKAPWEL